MPGWDRRTLLRAGAIGVPGAAFTQGLQAQRVPNVVLILADDLGYGDLGCYGGRYATPNLDRLAAEGIRFTQAYVAAPICSPSRVGIMTGQCPARQLIFSYLDSRAKQSRFGMRDWLDPEAPAIPRSFQQAGYATAHFGKWHMGGGRDIGDAPLPQAYGFQESLVSFEGLGDRVLPRGNRLAEMSKALERGTIREVEQYEQTPIYVDRALDFVERHREEPFYLHVWLNDVHDPFHPKPESLARFDTLAANQYEKQFAATLEDMDFQLGRLLRKLEEPGLRENTIVLFMSDNGPTAWPRYYKEGFEPPGSTAGLRGRKWSLYEGGIRVPFIAYWHGHTPVGKVNRDTLLSTLDLFPSLCALAGVSTPAGARFDGEDLSPALLGKPVQRKQDLFWEYGRSAEFIYPGRTEDRSPNLAVRSGPYKALVNADASELELYDFRYSDRERDNLTAERPDVANGLRSKMLEWRQSLPALT